MMNQNRNNDDNTNDDLVICNMNVEGMPWYVPPEKQPPKNLPPVLLSWKENWLITLQLWKNGIKAWAVFSLGMIIVILLLILLWT